MSGPSRSSAIYARLLALYPPEIRRGHRSEMLQNFDDLERTSSTAALWLVLGRDLVVSVGSHWIRAALGPSPRSFARQIRIILVVLSTLLVIAWERRPESEPLIAGFCVGYLIGWVSGWSQRRVVVVLSLLGLAVTATMCHHRFLLTACYGCTLGWLGGWLGRDQKLRRWLRRDSRNSSA